MMSIEKENREYALPKKRKNEKDIYHRKYFTVRKLGLLERDEYGCASIYTCAFCCCAFSFHYAQLREHIERAHPEELHWFPPNPQLLINYRVFGQHYKRNEYVLTDRVDEKGAPVWNHLPRPVEVDEADDEVLVDGFSPGQHFIPAVGHAPMEHFRGERRNLREREPVYRFPALIDKQWAKEQLKELHKIVEERKKTRPSRSLKRSSSSWSARRREPNSNDRKGGEKRRRVDSGAAAATTPRGRRTEATSTTPESVPLVRKSGDRSAREETTTPRSSRVTKRRENEASVPTVDKATQKDREKTTSLKKKEKYAAARTTNEVAESRVMGGHLTPGSGGEMGASKEASLNAGVEHYENEARKEDNEMCSSVMHPKESNTSHVEKMKVVEGEGDVEEEGDGDGVAPKKKVQEGTTHRDEMGVVEEEVDVEHGDDNDEAPEETVDDTDVMAESDQPMEESENGIDIGGLDSTEDSNLDDLEALERNLESFRVEETPEAEQGEMMELIMHGPLLDGEQDRREREEERGDAIEMEMTGVDGEETGEEVDMLPSDQGGGEETMMDGDSDGESGDEEVVDGEMEEGGEQEMLHILAHGPLEEEEDGDSLASGEAEETGHDQGSEDHSDSADTIELDEEEVEWAREREQARRDMTVLRGDWIEGNECGRTYAPPDGWQKDDGEEDEEEEIAVPKRECEDLVKECKAIQKREYEEAKKMNEESKKNILEEFRAAASHFPGLGGDVLGELVKKARGEEGDKVIREQSLIALKKEKERVKKCEAEEDKKKGDDSDSEGWVTASEGEEVAVDREKEQTAYLDATLQGDGGEGMEEHVEEEQCSVLTGEE